MGNTITQAVGLANPHLSTSPTSTGRRRRRSHNSHFNQTHDQHDLKSKTLPARHPRSSAQRVNSHPNSTTEAPAPPPPNGETSRVLFLLYLIHRTWNVVVDTVDTRSKRSRPEGGGGGSSSEDCSALPNPRKAAEPFIDEASSCGNGNYSVTITDLDDVEASSLCCSQYSFCSCSYCYDATQNVYNSIAEDCSTDSICQRTVSQCGRLVPVEY